jgi:hypothetical protein
VRPDGLVLRYLAAFGPASVKDVQAWCGVARLKVVLDRLRPQLVELFGVGRSSVRAAVQSLIGLGLVEMRPGRGAYVRRPSLDDVVLRYLAAFGPASVADVTTWCRLTGLRAVVERLRPRLRAFRGEDGRELFDLPDAPRPDPETPAPVRFLPEYDNLLLSHAERSRVFPDRRREALGRSWRIGFGSVLHDGGVCGVWRLERPKQGPVTLAVTLAARLPRRATASIEAEGRRYLRFAAPEADGREVELRVAD